MIDAIPSLGGDPDRVLLWGHSAGGHLALMAADARIRGVVGLGACVDPRALVGEEAALARDVFGPDLAAGSPACHPVPTRTLLVHGERDPVCAAETARSYARRESVELIEVHRGDHGLRWPIGPCREARQRAFAWALERVGS